MPWLRFVTEQDGIATWQPYRNGGYPLFADPEQFWFLVPFVDPASPNANLALNLSLFALIMSIAAASWLLARRLSLGPVWAAVAAILVSFNEQAILSEQSARFAFLINTASFIILLAVLAGRRRGPAQIAAMIACMGVALSVSFQYALLHPLAILAFFLWEDGAGWRVPAGKIASSVAKTAAIGVCGLLLAAVVVLPYLGHMQEGYLPSGTVKFDPVLPEGTGAIARLLLPFVPSNMPIYLGLPLLLAAVLAATKGLSTDALRLIRIFTLIGVFAGVFIIMCLPVVGPWIAGLYGHLPVLSTVRQFILAGLALSVFAALLACIVIEKCASDPIATLGRKPRVVLSVVLLLSIATAIAFGKDVTAIGSVIFVAGALAPALYLAWTAFGGRVLGAIERSSIGTAGLLSAALSVAAIAPIAFLETTPDRGVKLHVDNTPSHPHLLEVILASPEVDRRVRSDLSGALTLITGVRTGVGFSLYFPASLTYSFAYLSPKYDISVQRPHWVKPVDCASLDPTALDLLSVNFLLCRKGGLEGKVISGFEAVAEEKNVVLLRRPASKPTGLRVFCRHKVMAPPPQQAARSEVLTAFTRGELLLEQDPAVGLATEGECPQGQASLVSGSKLTTHANAVDIEIEAPRTGLLLLPDNFSKHWQVSVNGQAVAVLRAEFAYIGIPVARGTNRIELRFDDPYLRWGVWISVCAAVGLIGFWAFAALMNRTSRSGASVR